MSKLSRYLWVLSALALLVASSAPAAVVQRLYLEEMVGESAVIVHGTVIGSRVQWNADRTMIYTRYELQATQYLKGFLGATFEVTEPGGELDNLAIRATGTPRFRGGEEVLLFLWNGGGSSHYQVTGLEQGALRVIERNGEKYVNRSIPVRSALSLSSRSPWFTRLGSSATSLQLDLLLRELTVMNALVEAKKAAPKSEVTQ